MTANRVAGQAMLGILLLISPLGFGQKAPAPASTNAPNLNLAEIAGRVTAAVLANHNASHAYSVVRQYELSDANSGADSVSDVVARISYVPPGSKQYSIREVKGSGSGERIVRRVLEHEAAMASSWWRTALTVANYDFQLLGRENVNGNDCFVLGLLPKREDKDLIRGRAWVDAKSFNVRRIEGQPVKSPSWWVKRLDVNLEFSPVMGMWLQTATTARAEVRFFGEHTLTAHDVEYESTQLAGAHPGAAAHAAPSQPSSTASHSAPIVGAGVLPLPWRKGQ